MEDKFVLLTKSTGPYQKFLIEDSLKNEGIPFMIRETGAPTAIFGDDQAVVGQEFLVAPDRLQDAKDILCACGIVCEVSGRLLSRAYDEIVKPILIGPNSRVGPEKDLSRLMHFIEVNNKETSHALLELVIKEEGGLALLEELFFALAKAGNVPSLRILARVLAPAADRKLFGLLKDAMESGTKEERITLLEIFSDIPNTSARSEALAQALRDPALEIRDAAGEALFALGKGDFGYKADGPGEERESAIRDFLTIFG